MRAWLARIGVGLALLAAGFAVGIMVNLDYSADEAPELKAAREQIDVLNDAQDNAEERLWRLYRERTAYKEQLEALRSQIESVPAGAPSSGGVIGDGVHLVDEDISPGDYDGVVTGEYGYWARLKATDGTVNAIIENGLERGSFVLTVYPADSAVELSGVLLTPR